MIDDIIKQEKELQATLKTIKDLTEEHSSTFALKGMIPQIDKLIRMSEVTVIELSKWSKNKNLKEANEKDNLEL